MKVAIVTDWILGGGAEKQVLELHHMYPEAPIFTSYCTDSWRKQLDNKVVTGYLQRWPFSKLRKFIPFLRIWWFTRLNLEEYDLVICVSGAEAKAVNVPLDATHIAYINAPTHYYWSRYEEYLKHPGFGSFDWLARIGLKILVAPLRRWDYKAAQKADYVIANSTHIQQQISQYYNRESTIVFPPVDTKQFDVKPYKHRRGFIVTGRQTPYKRIDLAVLACTQLNVPLTVVGTGPEHENLKAMAGPSVTFTGFVKNNKDVAKMLAQSEAFLFCGVDDFGIAPVEAMACGTPVIAFKAGGALDYVNKKTGLFFEEQTVEAVVKALQEFQNKNYSSDDIKKQSQRFSKEHFVKSMHFEVKNALQ